MRESAAALTAFRDDPSGLVTACRRIVSRQLTCGSLWWLCSRMLCAADPHVEARTAVAEIEDDTTPRRLAAALPDDATVLVLGWQTQVASGVGRRGDVEVLVVDTLGEGASFVRHLESRDVEAVDVPLSGLGTAASMADLVVLEASAVGPDAVLATASRPGSGGPWSTGWTSTRNAGTSRTSWSRSTSSTRSSGRPASSCRRTRRVGRTVRSHPNSSSLISPRTERTPRSRRTCPAVAR